jgi:hypothetical protein
MRRYFELVALTMFLGCGTPDKKNVEEKPLNYLEKLANVHGFENWKSVEEIRFTFNVDRDTSHFERSWIWEPKSNRVTQIIASDTVSYLRKGIDSTLTGTDAAFINDKFWLLAPYQWIWDQKSFSDTLIANATAPISGIKMDKITITYGSEGGYTPGDAYDFYIGTDSLVKEWVFRKGNSPEPSLATTWEEFRDFNGLKIGTLHQNAEGSFKLYFSGIEVR